MWTILLHPKASSFLESLDSKIKERIKEKLRELKADPFRYLEHFEDEKYYKLRVGEYRALVDIDFKSKIIKVQVLDIRGNVYKKYKN